MLRRSRPAVLAARLILAMALGAAASGPAGGRPAGPQIDPRRAGDRTLSLEPGHPGGDALPPRSPRPAGGLPALLALLPAAPALPARLLPVAARSEPDCTRILAAAVPPRAARAPPPASVR